MHPSREQLVEQFRLQDQMNSLVNPEWLTAHYKWTRAMTVEAVELLDNVGWKWLKAQTLDMGQAQLELVDIWHFILSHDLARCEGEVDRAIVKLIDAAKHPQDTVFIGYAPTTLSHMDTQELIEAFVALAAGGVVSITAFQLLMEKLDLTWDALHIKYMAKNVLNIFRQMHGYKEGTYIKTWMGKEDNEVLTDLVTARPTATAEQLFTKLESIYTSVKETQ